MRRAPLIAAAGAALALAALLLSACGGATDASARPGTVPVVASTNVYGDIAKRVGGPNVSVTSIISDPEQDPHSYQASTQTQLALSRAKVVIENGGGYDDFVDTMLSTAKSRAPVLNAVKISGRTAPAGGDLNEHVFYDFPAMDRLAGRIAGALATADPAHEKTYTANARAFGGELSALEKRTAALKKAHAGEGVAITEPVPGYLLDAAGLRDRTPEAFSHAVEEGDDVPPRALRRTLDLFTGAGRVKALVYNAQTMSAQTQQVVKAARAGHVAAVPVTETLPDGKTYVTWMRANVDALARALGER
jgi:zinc/manganese transport system substrate-binding protein